MERELALSHVLWLGGATDSGKTTISQIIAARYGLQVYNYDRHDLPQMTLLAETHPRYQAFLAASLDENWVDPEPEAMLQFTLQAFCDRFPLVVDDLVALAGQSTVLAEGHGLTPELVSPLLSDKRQAIWLVPAEGFKWASMVRRNKPSFRDQVRDPERATRNVFARDMLVAAHVKAEAASRGLSVWEVDGSRSAEELAVQVAQHFGPFLRQGHGGTH